MKHYTHLSIIEREKLFLLRQQGMKYRDIAIQLKRSHSALVREYNRNIKSVELGYLPDSADMLAKARKASYGLKIDRHPGLKEEVIRLMRYEGYSPDIVAGRLKSNGAKVRISSEAIYQFVYSNEGIKLELYKSLIHRRPKRNQHYGRKTRSDYGIPERISISQRPALDPNDFGNFEADLTFFQGSKSINLLTMVDRKTGYFMANLNATKHSEPIALKLLKNITNFPKAKRKSITFDNGKEFVDHLIISQVARVPTYFCNPGSPWQKPYVETTHALLHRFIPKKTDPKTLTEEIVQNAVIKLNNLPRKRFNYRTPAEMLLEEKIYRLGALRP